jgi:hypothetical protein
LASVDPASGVKTVTTEEESSDGEGASNENDDEIDNTAPDGSKSETGDEIVDAPATINWEETIEVAQTNPDGSMAAPRATETDSGTDTVEQKEATARAPDGTTTTTASNTETGSARSSDPQVGNSQWTDSPPVTAGTGNKFTTGLIVPALDPSKVAAFRDILTRAGNLQEQIDAVESSLENAIEKRDGYQQAAQSFLRILLGGRYQAQADQWAAKAKKLEQMLDSLQQQATAIAKEYGDAGFDELEVHGYPQGFTDDLARGTPVVGFGLAGAVAAYQNAKTSIWGSGGLENADGPVDFVVTMFGPGLVAKGVKHGVGALTAFALKKLGKSLKSQIHHIATNKGVWKDAFEELFTQAGRALNDPENLMDLPRHVGRHIEEYHQFVYNKLKAAIGEKVGEEASNELTRVLREIRQILENNPRLPYRDGGLR